MPVWRCPHCGIPQAESSRCWVCRRSTTSCATCRHFRRGVAGGLGLCGLDPRRVALRGDEIRGCWVAALPAAGGDAVPVGSASGPSSAGATADTAGRKPRSFVPVEDLAAAHQPAPADADTPATAAVATAQGARAYGWSLWGEPET